MNKTAKLQRELEGLLSEKLSLDAKINHSWQQLRMYRIAAIRGGEGDNLEPLPQLGLDDQQRASQQNTERRELENYAKDNSPEHQRALANLNAMNTAA
jgi:hypothetical protein